MTCQDGQYYFTFINTMYISQMYNETEIYKMKHMYTYGKRYNLIPKYIKGNSLNK